MEVVGSYGETAALSLTGIAISNGPETLCLVPNAIQYVNEQGYNSLPVASIATKNDISSATSAKADNTAFEGMTAFQLVNTSSFDVEELALKYNTLVTVLSGIATTLNP